MIRVLTASDNQPYGGTSVTYKLQRSDYCIRCDRLSAVLQPFGFQDAYCRTPCECAATIADLVDPACQPLPYKCKNCANVEKEIADGR